MFSRERASEILHRVADFAWYGGFPSNISAFELGQAVNRAHINSNEENFYKEFLRGWDQVENEREDRLND